MSLLVINEIDLCIRVHYQWVNNGVIIQKFGDMVRQKRREAKWGATTIAL
jgi:hypothetical protein